MAQRGLWRGDRCCRTIRQLFQWKSPNVPIYGLVSPTKGSMPCLGSTVLAGDQRKVAGELSSHSSEQRIAFHSFLFGLDSVPPSTTPGILKSGTLQVQFLQRTNLGTAAGLRGGGLPGEAGRGRTRAVQPPDLQHPQRTCPQPHTSLPASHSHFHH